MSSYRINPYVSLVESTLFPGFVEYAIFHRLSGDLITPSEHARSFVHATKLTNRISLGEAELKNFGELGGEIRVLMSRGFLIPESFDPLAPFVDHHVTRPMQNPALAYRSKTGEWILVRTSMEHTVYSRKRNELPQVIEEQLSLLASDIFRLADGTKTLFEIYQEITGSSRAEMLKDTEFRSAINFLTTQERQLIKFTTQQSHIRDPYSQVNIIPRNLYHSDRWHNRPDTSSTTDSIVDFHLHGIDDADWEFDLIEPTVNHCFRFPHEALGELDYGSRFCTSTLTPDVLPSLQHARELEVLEVGGGRGSFARSFLRQAAKLNVASIKYHILDLSPELMISQKRILGELLPDSQHFHQDATSFDLPDHRFDLIVSNEVIADFPVASVERKNDYTEHDGNKLWQGEGAADVEKYGLDEENAPDQFLVNAGAFRFIERAWLHLNAGGTLLVTEYGFKDRHPVRSYHLNHDEFSIHFGYLAACASRVGFQTRLLTLKEFLNIDDDTLVLDGREEHILCLNHVFKNYQMTFPYAVISKSDFFNRFQPAAEEIALTGYSFSPLKTQYHFGPNIEDFFVLIMNKPL